jgi:LPS-assembly lipoprotein
MKFLPLIAVFVLSACGLSPVYGTHSKSAQKSEASAALQQVHIAPLPDREGQYLRNALIDRFYKNGYPTNPAYQLKIGVLKENKTAFDITVESEATRYQLKLSTTMTLINTQSPESKAVLGRNLYAVSSYNVLESEFSTRVSEQSAREAILNDLARQIEQQITLYLNQ